MKPIQIYMTSFFRPQFTLEAVEKIHERTCPGSFQLNIYDNGSDLQTQGKLFNLLQAGLITSLQLDSRNTGCLYNKLVFQAMTESQDDYYVVTDNDIFPPALEPCWLTQMIEIMDNHQEIALLTPLLPPIYLQKPYSIANDVVYCEFVGNTFKVVRRKAFPNIEQKLGAFGDDGLVSEIVRGCGWKVAFCKNIFCWHAGQCENWGYKPEEILLDERKAGYGKPFLYQPINELTYEPPAHLRIS